MSLPAAWVERIFDRLTAVYGHHFLGRWSGMDLAPVKANWGHELARFSERPEAIAYALENLPSDGQPPDVLQFRKIAASVPVPQGLPALPAPDPKGLLRIAAALRAGLENAGKSPTGKAADCIENLQRKRDTGQPMSAAQRDFLRRAEAGFGMVRVAALPGDFTPVPVEFWPPGMASDLGRAIHSSAQIQK